MDMKGGLGRLSGARPRGFASRTDLCPRYIGRLLIRGGAGSELQETGQQRRKGEYSSPCPLFQILEDIASLERGFPAYPRGPLRASETWCIPHSRSCAGPQSGGSGRASTLEELLQNPKLVK